MNDPVTIVRGSPMSKLQLRVVLVAIIINAIDGYDILAISMAAPGIAREWNTSQAALGIVLSMELIGMAIGALTIGRAADVIGRRPIMLTCQMMMAAGMIACALASSVTGLSISRLLVGVGIGGVIPAVTAVIVEFSNERRRDFWISCLAVGATTGVIVGGSIAAYLLRTFEWRAIFWLGAGMTAVIGLITALGVPETISFLCRLDTAQARAKVKRLMSTMGHNVYTHELPQAERRRSPKASALFARKQVINTLAVTCCYIFHMSTYYFVLKWLSTIMVDFGYSASIAASTLVWVNIGGLLGSAAVAIGALKFGARAMAIPVLLGSTLGVAFFARFMDDLQFFTVAGMFVGFCTFGGVAALYAVITRAFPPELQATGFGFASGVGRVIVSMSPIAAGFLFSSGFDVRTVAAMMSLGSLIAAGFVLCLRGNIGRNGDTTFPAGGKNLLGKGAS